MNSLLSRLKRLEEARGVDSSGYPPHSPQWEEYWFRRVDRHVSGESRERFPIEAIRAWMQRPDGDDKF